jgi:hypothetical protein
VTRQLTPEHLRALRAGRQRRAREAQREAVARVIAYKRWLERGSKLREIPEIPSDQDYEKWRAAQRPLPRPDPSLIKPERE